MITLCAIAAAVLFILAGISFGADEPGAGIVVSLVGTLFMVITIAAAAVQYGPLKTLDGKTYVVKAKTTTDVGGNKFIVLHDLVEEKTRVAEFSEYPPKGYQEVTANDGSILLVPLSKK